MLLEKRIFQRRIFIYDLHLPERRTGEEDRRECDNEKKELKQKKYNTGNQNMVSQKK